MLPSLIQAFFASRGPRHEPSGVRGGGGTDGGSCSARLPPLYQECCLSRQPGRGTLPSDLHPGATVSERLTRLSERLYRFDDTCNVYLLVDGDAGLLIDAGSGGRP